MLSFSLPRIHQNKCFFKFLLPKHGLHKETNFCLSEFLNNPTSDVVFLGLMKTNQRICRTFCLAQNQNNRQSKYQEFIKTIKNRYLNRDRLDNSALYKNKNKYKVMTFYFQI